MVPDLFAVEGGQKLINILIAWVSKKGIITREGILHTLLVSQSVIDLEDSNTSLEKETFIFFQEIQASNYIKPLKIRAFAKLD